MPGPDYIDKVYEHMGSAYGDKWTISADDFRQKMQDEAYAKNIYVGLKQALPNFSRPETEFMSYVKTAYDPTTAVPPGPETISEGEREPDKPADRGFYTKKELAIAQKIHGIDSPTVQAMELENKKFNEQVRVKDVVEGNNVDGAGQDKNTAWQQKQLTDIDNRIALLEDMIKGDHINLITGGTVLSAQKELEDLKKKRETMSQGAFTEGEKVLFKMNNTLADVNQDMKIGWQFKGLADAQDYKGQAGYLVEAYDFPVGLGEKGIEQFKLSKEYNVALNRYNQIKDKPGEEFQAEKKQLEKQLPELQKKYQGFIDTEKTGINTRITSLNNEVAANNKKIAAMQEQMAKDPEQAHAFDGNINGLMAANKKNQGEMARLQQKLKPFFQTPDEQLQDALATQGGEMANFLSNLPEGLSAEQKLNAYLSVKLQMWNELKGKVEENQGSNDMGRQVANWPGLSMLPGRFGLTTKEERMLQLEQEINQLIPIALLDRNPAGKKEDSGMETFAKAFKTTLDPQRINVAATQAQKNQAVESALQIMGIEGEVDPESKKIIAERADPKNFGKQDWANMLGTTTAFMGQFAAGTGATNSILKGYDFWKTLSASKNLFANMLRTGIQYQGTGLLFDGASGEGNFASGALGAVGSQGTELLLDGATRMIFGKNADLAGNVVLKLLKPAATLTGRGLAETAEETVQQLVQIHQQSDSYAEAMAAYQQQFGDRSEAFHFFVSTFVMGAGFGVGNVVGDTMNAHAKAAYEKLDPEEQKLADQVIAETTQDVEAASEAVLEPEAKPKEVAPVEEKAAEAEPVKEPEAVVEEEKVAEPEPVKETEPVVEEEKATETEPVKESEPEPVKEEIPAEQPPVQEEKNIESNEPIKINEDEAENQYSEGKLTEEDNPEQEPGIKIIEGKAGSENEAELIEVVEGATAIIDEATGVQRKKISEISTDETRFQGRADINDEFVQSIAENWNDADQDPIHVWTDPKDGKTYVLSGHRRFAAAQKAGRENVKIQDRSSDFTEEQAIRFATEESNANRQMETPLERAKTLRIKRERGDSKEDIDKFLNREGKNKGYVQNISHLNPSGKTIAALKAVDKSQDKTTQKEVEKIGDWIGEVRRKNTALTNAHENELYGFLINESASARIKTKAEFIQKVGAITGTLDFDATKPLNIKRFKNKTEGESVYDQEVADLKGKISEKQAEVDETKARFADPNRKDYVSTEAKDYESAKKNADEKIAGVNAEIKALQKQLQELYQNKGKYTQAGIDQGELFSKKKKPKTLKAAKKDLGQALQDAEALIEEFETTKMKAETISDAEKMNNPPAEGRPIKLYNEVLKIIRKYSPDTRVMQNSTGGRALGKYFLKSRNIAIKGMNDVTTAFHELAHAIDQQHGVISAVLDNKDKAIQKELSLCYLTFYPGAKQGHPLWLRCVEGFAVLMENYSVNPTMINRNFPELVKEFLTPGGKYHIDKISDMITDVHEMVRNFQNLNPLEQTGATVYTEEFTKRDDKGKKLADKITDTMADAIGPLERLMKRIGTHYTTDDIAQMLRFSNNHAHIARRNLEGRSGFWAMNESGEFVKKHDFNWNTIYNYFKKEVAGVSTYLDKSEFNEFGYWLIARRAHFDFIEVEKLVEEFKELNKKGDPVPPELVDQINNLLGILRNNQSDRTQVDQAYKMGKEKFAEVVKMYDALTAEDLHTLASDHVQLLSPETKEKLLSKEGYAPNKRQVDFDEVVGPVEASGSNVIKRGTKVGTIGSLVRRKGSSKPYIHPVLASMDNHAEVVRKALKQRTFNLIGEVSEKYEKDLNDVFNTHVPIEEWDKASPTQIWAKRKGKDFVIRVNDDQIAKVIRDNYSYQEMHVIIKTAILLGKLFRAGTTGAFAPFALTDFFVNHATSYVHNQTDQVPFIDAGKELAAALSNKRSAEHKYMKEYMYLAGDTQMSYKLENVVNPSGRVKTILKNKSPLEWVEDRLNVITKVMHTPANLAEFSIRIPEYIRARKAGHTQFIALEMAGRVGTPFHHIGSLGGKSGQQFIRAIPYWNAAVQVLAQTKETLATPEGRRRYIYAASALIALSASSLAFMLGDDDEERKEVLRNLTPQELNKYIYFPSPWKKGAFIKLRVPENISAFAGIVNMAMIGNQLDARYTAKEWFDGVTTFIPDNINPIVSLDPGQQLHTFLLANIPPAAKAYEEIKTNKKFFPTERPLENYSDLELRKMGLTEEIKDKYTGYLAEKLGATDLMKKMELSPKQIDHMLTGIFGRSLNYYTDKDKFLSLGGSFEQELYLSNTRAMRNFYEEKEKAEGQVDYLRKQLKEGLGKPNDFRMMTDDIPGWIDDLYNQGKTLEGMTKEEALAALKRQEKTDAIQEMVKEYKELDPELEPAKVDSLENAILIQAHELL